MTLSSALIVDEVRKHDDGRVDLLGLFEDISWHLVPFVLESLTLYLDLELDPADRGQRHELIFRLVAPDGKPSGEPWQIKFAIPRESEYPAPSVQLDPTLFALTFPTYGEYRLEIQHQGRLLRRLLLRLHPREPDAP